MDNETKAVFDQIVEKDQDSLTNEEKGFLMARRSYFNDDQRKRYADMIKLHEAGKLLESEVDDSDLESMSLKDIKALAKKEKVDITGLKTVADIAEAITTARDEE